MYRKEKPLVLKGSTSALCNNLSVQVDIAKNVINYAVVHKSVVNLVSATTDGSAVNHRQIVCKEPSATHGSLVLQTRIIPMPTRNLLVITSQRGIQMFEADGSIMLYWYALGDVNQPDSTQACFGRGICGVEDNTICVGNHEGQIFVFFIPPRGTNITLSQTLSGHSAAICDLESSQDLMASSDDLGSIIIWKAGHSFSQLIKINGSGYPCTSLGLWRDHVIGSYGSGHIRVFNVNSGKIEAEVTAHAKWITSLHVARKTGMVLSTAEDTLARVWQLKENGDQLEIDHRFTECITDTQLQGGCFISDDGRAFGVTGYDSNEINFFKNT